LVLVLVLGGLKSMGLAKTTNITWALKRSGSDRPQLSTGLSTLRDTYTIVISQSKVLRATLFGVDLSPRPTTPAIGTFTEAG
jgi:hypothetical protein